MRVSGRLMDDFRDYRRFGLPSHNWPVQAETVGSQHRNPQLSIWVKFFLDQAVVDSFSSIMGATLRFE